MASQRDRRRPQTAPWSDMSPSGSSPMSSLHRSARLTHQEQEVIDNRIMVWRLPPGDAKPPRPATSLPQVRLSVPRHSSRDGGRTQQTAPARRRGVASATPHRGSVRQEYKRPRTVGCAGGASRERAQNKGKEEEPAPPWWVSRGPNPQNGAHGGAVLASYADNRR